MREAVTNTTASTAQVTSTRAPHGAGALWRPLTAAALIALLGAAGCGGSSKKSTSPPAAAITRTEFVAKANAICAGADPALSAENAKLLSNPTPAAARAAVKNVYVPAIEGLIGRIRALGTPVGQEANVQRLLVLVQADLNKIKRKPLLMITTDAFGDFAKVAHPYGLTACAPLS